MKIFLEFVLLSLCFLIFFPTNAIDYNQNKYQNSLSFVSKSQINVSSITDEINDNIKEIGNSLLEKNLTSTRQFDVK